MKRWRPGFQVLRDLVWAFKFFHDTLCFEIQYTSLWQYCSDCSTKVFGYRTRWSKIHPEVCPDCATPMKVCQNEAEFKTWVKPNL